MGVSTPSSLPERTALQEALIECAARGAASLPFLTDGDRARMPVQQLAEVRLAQPAIDMWADLDADACRHHGGTSKAVGEINLAEAALPEQAIDLVTQLSLRAEEYLVGCEQTGASLRRKRTGSCGASGGVVSQHPRAGHSKE